MENPFADGTALNGSFVCDGREFDVSVTMNKGAVTVMPEALKGYSIVFSDNGTTVSYNGMDFESEGDYLSLFYPLYEMANGINTTISSTTLTHSEGYIFKDFK